MGGEVREIWRKEGRKTGVKEGGRVGGKGRKGM